MHSLCLISSLASGGRPEICYIIPVCSKWLYSNVLLNFTHRLKTWREPEGRIRLSQDDGPPAHEFIGDDYDEDNENLDDDDDEPLTERVRNVTANPAPALKVDNSKIIQLPKRPGS